MSDDSIKAVLAGKNTLRVSNEARGEGGVALAPVIEYGGMYQYKPGVNTFGDFRRPRPFIETTRDSLAATGRHIEALRDGLKSRGIPVD